MMMVIAKGKDRIICVLYDKYKKKKLEEQKEA